MGRTIKISELKKLDVFKNFNQVYIHLGNCSYKLSCGIVNKYHSLDYFVEVQLLGRMEFKEENGK